MNVMGVVLAAGLGKRMKSGLHKVLHPICGKPMVEHVIDALDGAGVGRKVVVVGHGAEAVREALGDGLEYALQERQLGTGHAVRVTETLLGGVKGVTIVVYGDTPLLTRESIKGMLELHTQTGASATLLTAIFQNPTGLGRIVRGAGGGIEKIVEEKDCNEAERNIQEINAGAYCFDNRKLFHALSKITNDNAQGEYYLTDVIGLLRSAGDIVQGYCTSEATEAFGVNDRAALAEAERLMRNRIARMHLLNGVTIVDPSHTYIDVQAEIGRDTILYPGTIIRGKTRIGNGCTIGPNSDIKDSVISDGASVRHSVLDKALVGMDASIGPFAHLRPGSGVGNGVKIGNFVEIKNSAVGDESKVSHLAYVGDSEIGKNVNVGCGVITVNYDGFSKHRTIIEDDAFIGSNVNLVAPVRIGKGAFVVAGSTVTENVGEEDLVIARERQTTKKGYAKKLKAKLKAKKSSN